MDLQAQEVGDHKGRRAVGRQVRVVDLPQVFKAALLPAQADVRQPVPLPSKASHQLNPVTHNKLHLKARPPAAHKDKVGLADLPMADLQTLRDVREALLVGGDVVEAEAVRAAGTFP